MSTEACEEEEEEMRRGARKTKRKGNSFSGPGKTD